MRVIYEGVLFPADENGLHGCALFGMPVHGVGESAQEALRSAADVLQEALEDLAKAGDAIPEPIEPPASQLALGTRVAVVATINEPVPA